MTSTNTDDNPENSSSVMSQAILQGACETLGSTHRSDRVGRTGADADRKEIQNADGHDTPPECRDRKQACAVAAENRKREKKCTPAE